MYSDDEMDCDSENGEEALEYETPTLASLRGKELTVQNADGTLRCPLSPSRKKQAYAYKDLLQHATAVASGKRGPEAAGRHSALKKFLESDLASLAAPPPERLLKVQKQLERRKEDMLVCPWSVVVYNIDISQRDPVTGQSIGFGKTELQKYFADFKPEKIDVLWSHRGEGHLGVCVVHFGTELAGLKDAQALESSFLDKELGLRAYERRVPTRNLGTEFYGWLAREEDYKGRFGRKGEEISRHLRKICTLKDICMAGEDMKRILHQQVLNLKGTVDKKIEESYHLKTQMEIIRRTAEMDRAELEEAHKKELDEVRDKARASEDEYNRVTAETNKALEKKEAELSQRDADLRKKESQLNSAAEKDQLQSQMTENQKLREMLANQQGLIQQKQADKIKLVEKHEAETRSLAKLAQLAQMKLANKQKNEMEKQQLKTILETEKLFGKLTVNPDAEEAEKKFKKLEELEEKLKDLEDESDNYQTTINTLMLKERESNDEIVDARKLAVSVLEAVTKDGREQVVKQALSKREEIRKNEEANHKRNPKLAKPAPAPVRVGVKMAGEIDNTPWNGAGKKKFKNNPDWQLKTLEVLSKWETRIRNSAFQPFKNVSIGDDKWEHRIDDENKALIGLKNTLGDEVYKTVTTALMELEEYNASGRYPIPVPWVFEKSRKASLKEVVAYFGEVIEGLEVTLAELSHEPRKKARG